MDKIVLFCKTYRKTLSRTINLIRSVKCYNKDNIPLYISVPKEDYKLFKNNIDTDYVKIIIDEEITDQLIKEKINAFSIGYINQQIVKMELWKLNLFNNYFCIDADGYFIRDFYISDFIVEGDNPYSILLQNKDLAVQKEYQGYYNSMQEKLEYIKTKIDNINLRYMTFHGILIYCCKVLKSFNTDFLIPNKLTWSDLLQEVSYEFMWYNIWLQKNNDIKIIPIEPLFKIFHYKQQYVDYKMKQITEKDLARGYIGVIVNSNWSSKNKLISYDNNTNYKKLKWKLYKKINKRIINFFLK